MPSGCGLVSDRWQLYPLRERDRSEPDLPYLQTDCGEPPWMLELRVHFVPPLRRSMQDAMYWEVLQAALQPETSQAVQVNAKSTWFSVP